MKFAKQLLALAVVGAAMSAQAESNINSGAAPGLSTTARLNFSVIIPRIIFLRVGTGTNFAVNTAVDTVTFTVPDADVGTGTDIAGVTVPAGGVVARVLGNGGNVSFSANGTSGGLTNTGLTPIPWTQIAPSAVGALPHPAIGNGVSGAISTLTATLGVVDQTATWNFNYLNDVIKGAGTYNGTVTYTAALP